MTSTNTKMKEAEPGQGIFPFLMNPMPKVWLKILLLIKLNLNDKKFEPRSIRYKISNAKNLGQSPDQYLQANPQF